MKQVIDDFISKHELIQSGDHLMLAVSGGPDSMAMLKFFQNRQSTARLLLTVVHVEHGLRGEDSLKDAAFIEGYCRSQGISFYLHKPDVKARKELDGLGTQEAARLCRYEWFETMMPKIKADKLVLAHHGDDQIETMLMRQIRGSLTGRKGIPLKRPFSQGLIIRPFLCVEKSYLIDYCEEHDVPFRIDLSNQEGNYQRNRIRKSLIPFMKQENPKVHEIFQFQSEVFAEEDQWMQLQSEAALKEVIDCKETNFLSINQQKFLEIHHALQRRVIQLILNYLSGSEKLLLDRHHIKAIQDLLKKKNPSSILHLPDRMLVERSYEQIIFSNSTYVSERKDDVIVTEVLEIPGVVNLPRGKLTLHESIKDWKTPHGNGSLSLDLDKVTLPLILRSRKKGDRMSYLGGEGTKKLKDLFIDGKIPKRDRDLWPIVTDSHDIILWVPFLKRSAEAVVGETSTRVIQMTYDIHT
ncbi:tRNA lysidine(34) synthetase TilS [Salipaludibacillus sp. HK11]|uniref:tRNA lysidine(34) synthetase TilS n=1 Tax=Salipaludibacillus sp. HK11 TaxID=3394320 RepID=UPI0039FCDF58